MWTIRNAREATLLLDSVREERQTLLDALHRLEQQVAVEAQHLGARLVRQRGGGLLWRRRARTPAEQTAFELMSPTGQRFLQTLSPPHQRRCLDLEAERLRLNLQWQLATGLQVRLQHYLDRYTQLRHHRKALALD